MKLARRQIARTVADRTLNHGADKAYAREVASLLLADRRTSELDSLLRDVQAEWAESGFVEAITASAHPLSVNIRNDITAQVKRLYPTARKVVITETHDPGVIGGVRVNLPDQQLDLSIEAKLNTFKQLTTGAHEI